MKIKTFIIENREFVIYIGTNAIENWRLIDNSEPIDLWFHLEGHPSGHVVVKEININNKNIYENTLFGYPNNLIIECAKLCKNQSKFKNVPCKIIYTTINNITKAKEVGSVFTKNEKYISL